MRKGTSYTVSHGTGHHLFNMSGSGGGGGSGVVSASEFEPHNLLHHHHPQQQQQQHSPPIVPPKTKRNSTTLTLRNKTNTNSSGANTTKSSIGIGTTTMGPSSSTTINSLLNPKRVSVATSSFWDGHPDMGQLVRGWELGLPELATSRPGDRSSLWGCTFDPPKQQSHLQQQQQRTATLPSGGEYNENSSSRINVGGGGGDYESLATIWGDPPAVKKGILLQQKDKLLSRWKERYCILTRDYLHCFQRTSSIHRSSGLRLSEMGNFIFKLRLAEIDEIEWETKRNCSIIVIILPKEPKIHLRVLGDNVELLRQWFTLLQECIFTSKERRRALRTMYSTISSGSTSTNTNTTSSGNNNRTRSMMSLSDGGGSGGSPPSSTTATATTTTTATTKSTSSSGSAGGGSSSMSADDHDSAPILTDSNRQDLQQQQETSANQTNSNTYDKTDKGKKIYAQLRAVDDDDDDYVEDDLIPHEKVVLRRDLRKTPLTTPIPTTMGGSTRTTTTVQDFLRDKQHNNGVEREYDENNEKFDCSSSDSAPQVPMRKQTTRIHINSGYSIPIDFTTNPQLIPPQLLLAAQNSLGKGSPSSTSSTTTAATRTTRSSSSTGGRYHPRPESWAPSSASSSSPKLVTIINNHHNNVNYASNNVNNAQYQRVANTLLQQNSNTNNSQLVRPHQHKRTFSNCGVVAGAGVGAGITPSIHTSEITFRKMC